MLTFWTRSHFSSDFLCKVYIDRQFNKTIAFHIVTESYVTVIEAKPSIAEFPKDFYSGEGWGVKKGANRIKLDGSCPKAASCPSALL